MHTQWFHSSLSWPGGGEQVANKVCWRHHPALAGSVARQCAVFMRHHGLRQWSRAGLLPVMGSNDGPRNCIPQLPISRRSGKPVTHQPPNRSTERHGSLNAGGLAQTANYIDSCSCPPRTVVPVRPVALPFECTPANNAKIEEWLLHNRYSTPGRTARCHAWLARQWRSIWGMMWSPRGAHRSPSADTLAGAGAIRPQARWGPRGHRKDPLRRASVLVPGSNEEVQRHTPQNCGSIASE